MNKAMLVMSLLAVTSALAVTNFPVVGHLQSVILQSCALFGGAFGATFFKLVRSYKRLVLLFRYYILHNIFKQDFGKDLLPTGLPPETSDALSAQAPFAVVDLMRDILTEYEAQIGVSKHRPEPARQRPRGARVVNNKAARSADPAQPGRFEKLVSTDGKTLKWVARRLAEFPGPRPGDGFFRAPWLEERGRPLTTEELYKTELEMVKHVDANECMPKLICEVAAEPGRFWKYHFRMVMFFQGLRSLAGENSGIVRRHDNAFRIGFNQFRGDSSMCAKIYDSCR
ncbi:hypothetical protein MTO96_036949 [Rhipicephalus appendiculatus]